MLLYDYKVEKKNLFKQTEKTKAKTFALPFWLKWVRYALELAVNIGIGIAANFFTPGVGIAVEFLATTLTDFLFNTIFNLGKINWKEFAISTSFNAINALSKITKLKYLARKQNKIYSLADNINLQNKELKNQILKQAKTVERNFGNVAKNSIDSTNFNMFEFKNAELLNVLNQTTPLSYKTTSEISKQAAAGFNKAVNKTKNTILKVKSVVDSFVSPRRAGRKLADLILKKPKRLFNKTVNNWFKKYIDFKKINWLKDNTLEDAKNIPLNSHWLDSLKITRANSLWSVKNVNCLVKFQPEATNNKSPVLLWDKDFNEILKFLTTDSPGKHYLNNFAWGWEIGKILRNNKKYIKTINIPLFTTFISNLAYVQKTIGYFVNTAQAKTWLWNKEDNFKEFGKGIFENSYSGWRFPGANKIISYGRAIQKGNASFITHTGVRQAHASMFKRKLKNSFKTYTYSNSKRRKN